MRFVLYLQLLFLAAPTFAAEGVLEINQACAEGPGCFVGDGPGFPVTINAPGSYALTGNLLVDAPVQGGGGYHEGIQINAEASLDLRGFGVRSDRASAIRATAPVALSNGHVVGLDEASAHELIALASSSTVSNIAGKQLTVGDGGPYLVCGDGCVIDRLRIFVRQAIAVQCGSQCIIKNAAISASGDGEIAISCGDDCVAEVITMRFASFTGGSRTKLLNSTLSWDGSSSPHTVHLGDNSVMTGCSVALAPSNHVPASCDEGCTITDNTFFVQGGTTVEVDPLLIVGTGSVVRGNTFQDSATVALELLGDAGYGDNVFTNNNGGNANPQVSGGTDLGGNLCGTRTTCP